MNQLYRQLKRTKVANAMVRIWRLGVSTGPIVCACVLLAGCAGSTVDSRKKERAVAYAALSNDERALVDQGQIRVGMNPDAVYVAWGAPAQVLKSGDASGEVTTWLYTATATDTVHSWHYREYPRRDGSTYLDRSMDVDYAFRDYVSAELIFRNDRLEKWRMLPKPMETDLLMSTPYGR